MATVNQNDEQQNGQTGPVPIAGTGGASASGRGSAGQAATPGVSNVQNNAGAQNQQGYTDVGAYLNANQAGANQLGGQVAQNLTNQYNTTKQGIDTSSQNFQGAVNQGYVPENTQLIQQAASDPYAFANTTTPATQTNSGAGAAPGQLHSGAITYTPASTTPNTANITAFQQQLNDQYTGPTTWGDLGTLQGTVAQANQEAALANTPGGNNVLAQQVEQPTSSAGVNSLDALLLGAPGASSQVQAAAAPYAGLTDYLDAQNTANLGAVTTGQNAAQQASQDALNAFTGANGALTNLNTSVNKTTTNDLSQAQAQQAALKADLANIYGGQAVNNTPTTLNTYGGGTTPWYNTTNYNVNSGALSPQDLQALGITQDQWNQLSGALKQAGTSQYTNSNFAGSPQHFHSMTPTSQIDLSQYLNQVDPTQAINANTVATPQQMQEMAAIQSLLGSQTPQGSALNPALASLAGTYNPANNNQFNFQNALTGVQGTATAEQQAAQNEANLLEQNANAAHKASAGSFFGNLLKNPTNVLAALNPTMFLGQQSLKKLV